MRKFIEIETTDDKKALVNIQTINYACIHGDKEEFILNTTSFIWNITKESYINIMPYLIAGNEKELKELLEKVDNHFKRVDEWTRNIQEYKHKLDVLNRNDRPITTEVLKKHYMFQDFSDINKLYHEVAEMMKSQSHRSDKNQVWEYSSDNIQNMIVHYKEAQTVNQRWIDASEDLIFNMWKLNNENVKYKEEVLLFIF